MIYLFLVSLAGALLRLLYGGAPHIEISPGKEKGGWLKKVYCYPLFVSLAMATLYPYQSPTTSVAGILSMVLIAVSIALVWNLGHGSYLFPGNGSTDNEFLFNRITPILSLGATPGSVRYCCFGMAVRYGLPTALVGLVMYLCNHYLGTEYDWRWGAVGFLAGPLMFTLVLLNWDKWFIPGGWMNSKLHNGPFELGIGAIIYDSLWWSVYG